MFSLFVVIDLFLFMRVRIGVIYELIQLLLINVNWIFSNPFKLITIFLDPFLFHGLSESDLGNLCPNATFHLRHVNFLAHLNFRDKLELRRSIGSITLSLISQLDNFPLDDIENNVLESNQGFKYWINVLRCYIFLLSEIGCVRDLAILVDCTQYEFLKS